MINKEKRTRDELAQMVMEEVSKHPECADITGAAVIEISRRQNYQPNWDVAWSRSGKGLADPKAAGAQIVRELQNKYDLS